MIKWQKRKRLAFKITGPSRIGYLTSIFPDALFVEITREPFSNIRSLLKVPFWEERGMHQLWWRGAYTEEEQRQAIQWRDRPALITALQYKKVRDMTIMEANRSNVKFLSIAFEDFVKRPYDTIDNILSFVELNKSKAVDKYMKRNKIFDRNSNAKQYFDQHDIEKMEEILGEYCN